MLPGARGAPTSGANACTVPCGVSSGAALGVTLPTSSTFKSLKPPALMRALIVRLATGLRGVQVPEYKPYVGSTRGRARGGSPLVNVVTTCAPVTTPPQLSTTLRASGVGHAVAAEKLLTRPVCTEARAEGAQAARGNGVTER